jgi:alkanesulfonate monooxygenase SsuD/methylene tetrahydromethanopterin reductase-like flavin-dependent oxidoreductase (luciferase family)
MFPKPVQDPFPIYLTGTGPDQLRRVATMGDGWVTASSSPDRLGPAIEQLREMASLAGRNPDHIEVCAQLWVGVGKTPEAARNALTSSQHFRRMRAQKPDADEDAVVAAFAAGNLLGTPNQISEQIARYRALGVQHFALIFLADTVEELAARVDLFGRTVLHSLR